ncbi:MAG: holin family protein [Pseudomonadota bacterium]
MGLMRHLIGQKGVGGAVQGVAEVFVGNAAERDRADLERIKGAQEELQSEFSRAPSGPFDTFVNALNRLPRPLLAIGTIGLFVYAMADPAGFSMRMQGLAYAPEQLWWLLGAIVSFYFGAREMHHFRRNGTGRGMTTIPSQAAEAVRTEVEAQKAAGDEPKTDTAPLTPVRVSASPVQPKVPVRASDPDFNAALEEWKRDAANDRLA